jgi:iron uptake system component EfeO
MSKGWGREEERIVRLSRKRFLGRAMAFGGLIVVSGGAVGLSGCGEEDEGGQEEGATAEARYAGQVAAGLGYFRGRADEQLPLAEALLSAVSAGNMEEARTAYVAARPPYEEIEVLAASFEQTDSDIDARPYSFDEGESSEDFKGFHRIEGLLYRDEDLEAALPYAEGLVESVKTLRRDLYARENFDAAGHFGGMIGLANEIPAKKISSEEETYSDQSLLIFRHNWIGIHSQFEPFEAELARRDADAVAEVEEAYEAARSLVEPYFSEGDPAAQPYSRVPMGVRAGIVRASTRLRDSLTKAAEVLELV